MPASSDAGSLSPHTPVLYQPVLAALVVARGGQYIDGTVGAGGHAAGILDQAGPDSQLLGLDRDPDALNIAEQRLSQFGNRVHLRNLSYSQMDQAVERLGWIKVTGILLDLGLSSMQLEDPERGFSFRREGPLDMRFDPQLGETAADLVNGLSESELGRIFREFGEERQAGRLARAVVDARPLHTTLELAEVIAGAVRSPGWRIHPATRAFQALRIAVNHELDSLRQGLKASVKLLRPGGRLAVISFHSLEDRIVKHHFRRESRDCVCPPGQPICTCDHKASLRVVTRKPISVSREERERNPRSRSAKLRIAERLSLA